MKSGTISSETDQVESKEENTENPADFLLETKEAEQAIGREQWIRLMGSYYKRINLEAKGEVIGGFVIDGNDMFRAASYNGVAGSSQGLYCYFFNFFFDKGVTAYEGMGFPEELNDVADDIRENHFSIWSNYLEMPNASFLGANNLSLEVEKKEIVRFNGKDFLREEIFARGERTSGTETTTRFVCYYYQAENGQGFCVFGDRSEEQDQFENIKTVADAIMATYQESDE